MAKRNLLIGLHGDDYRKHVTRWVEHEARLHVEADPYSNTPGNRVLDVRVRFDPSSYSNYPITYGIALPDPQGSFRTKVTLSAHVRDAHVDEVRACWARGLWQTVLLGDVAAAHDALDTLLLQSADHFDRDSIPIVCLPNAITLRDALAYQQLVVNLRKWINERTANAHQ